MTIINRFYEYLNNIYVNFMHTETQYINNIKVDNFTTLKCNNIIKEDKYIPIQIVKQINEKTYSNVYFKNIYKNINLEIDIYYLKQQKLKREKTQMILNYIFFIIYYIHNINVKHNIQELKIKLICCTLKKTIENGNQLDTVNVNSGMTTRYYNGNISEIIVYRDEEMFKVLIHELLHSFDVDSKQIKRNIEYNINSFFGIDVLHSSININESFVETYACLLNVFIVSKILKRDFKILLDKERNYCINQANKLLGILHLDIENNRLINRKQNRQEATHVLSYYILKALNFMYIEEFLLYLKNEGYKCQKVINYAKHLEDLLKKEWWYKGNKTIKQSNTLRMSCVDISIIFKKSKSI